MTSLSQLVNLMQPWKDKYNDDYDQIHKWLAGTSDSRHPISWRSSFRAALSEYQGL